MVVAINDSSIISIECLTRYVIIGEFESEGGWQIYRIGIKSKASRLLVVGVYV